MKYMMLMAGTKQNYDEFNSTWSPQDMARNFQFMHDFNAYLNETGEWVDGKGLAGPETLKVVTSADGTTPAITDGPFPEAKEFLAGFWIVDVDSEQRVLELAARVSASPGPGGEPAQVPIQIYPIADGPPPVDL